VVLSPGIDGRILNVIEMVNAFERFINATVENDF
jgi:hypothetical protein